MLVDININLYSEGNVLFVITISVWTLYNSTIETRFKKSLLYLVPFGATKMSMNSKLWMKFKNTRCYVPTVTLKFIQKMILLSNLSVTRASLRGSVTIDALADSGVEPDISDLMKVEWLIRSTRPQFKELFLSYVYNYITYLKNVNKKSHIFCILLPKISLFLGEHLNLHV